ncbi:MAG TPA: DUF4153 domain-containing protein [Alphaproteobacteria bacterium]|nr:DUF4153 domain-containing protein [Alphaproteobacteria bacterium]
MDEDSHSSALTTSTPARLIFRLALGLFQGLALAFLFDAEQAHHWPAANAQIFAPAILFAAFWPLLVLVSLNIRPPILFAWAAGAAALLIGLSEYDVWRMGSHTSDHWPSGQLIAAMFPFLFIAQALITAGDHDRKLIAQYATYFDTAWKLGLQLALASAFVTLFWIVLQIGAQMFHLIGLNFMRRLIENRWFAAPATATAYAYAIELTDVRVGLVRGLRTLALMLQSWILPVMVILTVAFLAALPFTGVEPLWATRSATSILLTAAAVLVFLINAAYRDGAEEEVRALVIRSAAAIGAVALVPLVAIACYALMLRIGQYGLTPDRVIAFFACGIAATTAIGYAVSVTNIGGWLRIVEATNIFVAFVLLAVILSLFTPLADPARLSVDDQITRLKKDKITAEEFDYSFLRFKAGRYGEKVLAALAKSGIGKDAAKVASLATDALKAENLGDLVAKQEKPTPTQIEEQITVHPKGASLPAAFLSQDWTTDPRYGAPPCLAGNVKCDAFLLDLDGDGTQEIVIVDYSATVFKAESNGSWKRMGSVVLCDKQDLLKADQFSLEASALKDIVVGGTHLRVMLDCPNS